MKSVCVKQCAEDLVVVETDKAGQGKVLSSYLIAQRHNHRTAGEMFSFSISFKNCLNLFLIPRLIFEKLAIYMKMKRDWRCDMNF